MGNSINFKGWAVSRGIKQKDIAKTLNVSLNTVNNKMNGKRDFTLQDIRILHAVYGVDADVFLQ